MKHKKENPQKIIYYEDELCDEFSTAVIKAKPIDEKYKYLGKTFLWKIGRFIAYRIVAYPIAFLYCKIALHWKTENREVLREFKKLRRDFAKKQKSSENSENQKDEKSKSSSKPKKQKLGCFLYANHTQPTGDAFMPSMMMCPYSVYAIVHPNNVSMPVLGRFTPYLGALPLPDDMKAMRHFKKAVETRIREGACINIYPEAHIWPYYVGIRNFQSGSMYYPVEYDVPSFVMTTTYRKRKHSNKPRVVTYLDGPFFRDETIPKRKQPEELRNRIYAVMKERSKNSDCEYIRYEKKQESEN